MVKPDSYVTFKEAVDVLSSADPRLGNRENWVNGLGKFLEYEVERYKGETDVDFYQWLRERNLYKQASMIAEFVENLRRLGYYYESVNDYVARTKAVIKDFNYQKTLENRLAWLLLYEGPKGEVNVSYSSIREELGEPTLSEAGIKAGLREFGVGLKGPEGSYILKGERLGRAIEVAKILVLWELSPMSFRQMRQQKKVRIPTHALIPDANYWPFLSLLEWGDLEGIMLERVSCKEAFSINWIEYRLKKSVQWSRWKGNLVEVRKHPLKYLQFLQEVYSCDNKLEEIYETLYWSYFESFKWMAGFTDPNRFQDYVKHVTEYIGLSSWLERARGSIDGLKRYLTNTIAAIQGACRLNDRLNMACNFLGISSAFIPLLSQLNSIIELASSGRFVSSYREMRRTLEDMAWLFVNDAAALSTEPEVLRRIRDEVLFGPLAALEDYAGQSAQYIFYPPFATATPEWFKISQQCKIRKEELSVLEPLIHNNRLDYLSLLALAFPNPSGNTKCVLKCELKRPSGIPCVNPDSLEHLLEDADNALLEYFRKKRSGFKLGQNEGVALRFPTEDFVIRLASELVERHERAQGESWNSLEDLYNSYSNFIHAYESTRVPLNGMSVAEAVIFSKEAKRFASTTRAMLKGYRNMVKAAADGPN